MNIGLISQRRRLKEVPIGITWEMGINLSRQNNGTPDTVPNWNNVRPAHGAIMQGTTFPDLVDTDAVNRNVTFGVSSNGATSNDWYSSGDLPPGYIYPASEIYYAAWFPSDGQTVTFTISGLDNSAKYSLRFMGGDGQSNIISRITINSTFVDVNATTDVPTTADFDDPAYGAFDDISPVSGAITFTAARQGGDNYWMLMGIRIREYGAPGPPEPSPKSFEAIYNNNPANTSPFGYYEFLPEGYDESESNYPVIISLHGGDEVGNGNSGDLQKVLAWGIPKMCNAGTFNENFIALSIQYDFTQAYDASTIRDFIDYVKLTYKADPDRIYMTGMSAGGMVMLYYLQNYTNNHGIAAVVPVSSPGEVGYTDAALIADSGCPQWWLSNIGDPTAPWENDGGGYTSILNVVSAINAVDPTVIEKLTGFNNNTHDGTWDGIYDGSLIGTANVNYDPFDESIYDWLMSHTL